jgi:hypothetical protein
MGGQQVGHRSLGQVRRHLRLAPSNLAQLVVVSFGDQWQRVRKASGGGIRPDALSSVRSNHLVLHAGAGRTPLRLVTILGFTIL